MHFITINLTLAPLFWTARAASIDQANMAASTSGGGHATIWKGAGCTGDSEIVAINVATDWCFEGVGGQSFNNFQLGTNHAFVGPTVTTWSGSNYDGSSAVYEWDTWGNDWGCVDVPFASVELTVVYK